MVFVIAMMLPGLPIGVVRMAVVTAGIKRGEQAFWRIFRAKLEPKAVAVTCRHVTNRDGDTQYKCCEQQ